jgi:hypothetical protein
MNSQTFASPSLGSLAGRGMSNLTTAFAQAGRAAWNLMAEFGQHRARAELLRMADSHAISQPELAGKLRRAADRNWYGEA